MLVVGHRGAPLNGPENTILSFRKAVDMGADMLEMDVHVCASGELVVIHDRIVDRTTDGTGEVSKLDLSEIKELDGGSGESIPILDEVIAEFSGRVGFNIELKGKGTAEPLRDLLMKWIGKGSISPNDILISSFRPDEIFDIRSHAGEMKFGYIFEARPYMGMEFAHEVGAWSIHPRHDLIDEKLIEKARELSLKVITWTVNDEVDMKWLMKLGVDGIITDRPGFLADLVKS